MSDERFERLERKIDVLTTTVASRLDQVNARFDQVDARFDRADRRFDRLEKYLKSIEKTQGHINGELSDKVAKHEKRLIAVEKKMGVEPIE